ncbi:MAG TPA: aminopeptidase N [Streptosporangiaceae bacterium]|nr:aminopeptidase N [Streptosporangiaceae bacterium]
MPIAEITRAETSQRARLLRVDSYDIWLDLTRGNEVFGSVSVIRFGCREPGAASYVDLIADSVHEITLNGAAVDVAAAARGDGRITLTALAAENVLRVAADCRYSGDGTGLHRAVDPADGKVYTYTKFEPAYARRVYANFEQPDLKASFTFHVTAPARWTVLSNQPAAEPVPDEGGARSVWHFPPTPPISTYLSAVAAGEYRLVQASHTTPRGQMVPLGLACRASLAGHLDADEIFAITRQGLDFYTGLFRGDFPFAKYDQVFVPDYSVGATENVGCVVISDELLFRSRVTSALHELRAMVILHEMAHMWFGNLVTMKWWDDLWLNESFAEFCGTLASAEATRFADAWTTFCAGRKTWGYMQDRLPSTHPVAADVPTLTQAVANFDGISYAKGASVLRQLLAFLGRPAFEDGIRTYLAGHAWGNATLADLLAALEQSAGASLASWSRAWLQTAGPNTLRPEFEVGADGAFTSFAVLQQAPAEHPTLRPHHLAVGLYSRAGGTLELTRRVEIAVAGARTELPELAGVARPDLVLLNDGDLDYAVVRFDARSLRTLTEAIGTLGDPLARAVCWGAAIDMLREAELPLPAFVRMLANGMGRERSVAVLQALHSVTDQVMTLAGDPAWVPEGKAELAAAGTRLLQAAEPGSDHQLAWAQLLSWTAATPDQLDLLAGLLDRGADVPGLAVDAELRWAILRRLAVTGRAGDAEIHAELRRDPTDAGTRHAAACRAAIPDAAHKAAAWHLLAESGELGALGAVECSRGFIQAEHADLLAPYAERYFEALPAIWATRGEHIRVVLGRLLFPYPAASSDMLGRIDAFLATPRDPGLARVLTETRDVVVRALRSRALPARLPS